MLKVYNIFGKLHLFGMVIKNIYGFIIPKYILFDKLYLISFVFIQFSWLLCKDECIISYLIKKYKNKNYLLGSEPENIEDIIIIFPNKNVYYFFYNANHLLHICSLLIVNNRTIHIPYTRRVHSWQTRLK
jgi:hypothetical protein